MIIIKSTIKVINVEYGKGKAEFINAQIITKWEETQKIVVVYAPPKIRNWTKDEHEKLIKGTLESLERIF